MVFNFLDKSIDKLKARLDGWQDYFSAFVDILLVAAALYLLFLFLKKHNSARLIKVVVVGLISVALLSSPTLGLSMVSKVAGEFVLIAIIALVLLFPQDVRRTLFKLSSPKNASEVFTTEYDVSDEELKVTIDEIVRAVLNMAKKDTGALIVIAPREIPYNILESGTRMDAILSSQLLECIFNTKASLHDGAVFIRANRIIASGCFLSLTQDTSIDKELGTRHRAAIGVTETNNVLAIIVSEETGIISVAFGGELTRYYDSAMLHEKLEQVYGLRAFEGDKHKRRRRRHVK